MKFAWALFLPIASAQYFSEGWKPGQQVTTEAPTATQGRSASYHTAAAAAAKKSGSIFDLNPNKILSSEPAVALFSKFGINITERLQVVNKAPWDDRVTLLTDSNFEELVVNETLTAEEEKERVWAIIISAATARDGGVSQYVDEGFDIAYNMTLDAEDLPNVRWGRIDYLNVTYLTTKWAVWQAPTIVILQDRGRSLRFFRPHFLRMKEGAFREFLKQEIWKNVAPWQTSFAPGGKWEWLIDFFALWMTRIYSVTVVLPRWVLFILSGTVASFVINLLHRGDPKPVKRKPEQAATDKPQAATATPAAVVSGVKSSGAKKRAGKK